MKDSDIIIRIYVFFYTSKSTMKLKNYISRKAICSTKNIFLLFYMKNKNLFLLILGRNIGFERSDNINPQLI